MTDAAMPGARYAVATRGTAAPASDGALEDGCLVPGVARWGDWPPLVDADEALGALPAALARSLRMRAGRYASLAGAVLMGGFTAADPSLVPLPATGRITVLSAEWHGLPPGGLVYLTEIEGGRELCFVRDDVIVDAGTGEIEHVDFFPHIDLDRPAAAGAPRIDARLSAQSTVGDALYGLADAALTMGEYASFLPALGGPVVAGVVHVFHSLFSSIFRGRPEQRRPELTTAEVVELAADAYVTSRVDEFRAIVTSSYRRYRVLEIQLTPDARASAVDNLRTGIVAILTSDMNLAALALLENDRQYRGRGALAWIFAKQFQLLLLRQAAVLDGAAYQEPTWKDPHFTGTSDSPYWAQSAQAQLDALRTLEEFADTLHDDEATLPTRVSEVKAHMGYDPQYGDVPAYFYFEDSRRPPEQDRPREEFGKNYCGGSGEPAREQVEKARRDYIDKLPGVTYRERWGFDDPAKVARLRALVVSTLWSVIENLELFIVPCVVGWEAGDEFAGPGTLARPDESRVLPVTMAPGTRTRRLGEQFGGTIPEIASGAYAAESPVYGYLRAGQGITVALPEETGEGVGDAAEKRWSHVYAVHVRCWVGDESMNDRDARGRRLLIRWADLPADHATSRSILVTPTAHPAGDQTWVSRTVTLPLAADDASTLSAITVEGAGPDWAPDVLEVRVARLQEFPQILG